MSNFDYAGRARAVAAARAEVDAAIREVVNRNDERDPKTRRWLDALTTFYNALQAAYPESFAAVDRGRASADTLHTADMLDFLEADPIFFGSGYMKENILTCLKRRYLEPAHIRRLQDVIVALVRRRDCREFRHYCRTAAHVDGDRLRAALQAIVIATDQDAQRRAIRMLEALDKATRQR